MTPSVSSPVLLEAPHEGLAPADGEFQPLPWLRNPHVQTVLAAYLPGPVGPHPDRQHVVWLPDGDGLVLHENRPPGTHASAHLRRMTRHLLSAGVRTVRIDLRGTGKGLPLARQVYHGGRSDDVRAALAAMHSWSPSSPLLLLGVSLGGNLVLKLAGEAAERPVEGLVRVAALAPPIDLGSTRRASSASW
jgi:predicted alpha/beta-fold hydrolase